MSTWFDVDIDKAPTADRMEFWRASVCDQFVPIAVNPSEDLHGRVAGGSLAETRLRRMRASAHSFERRASDIRTSDPEVLHVLVMEAGSCRMEQDGRGAVLAAGDVALYDSSRPFSVTTPGPFQFTIGLVPKRILPLRERVILNHTARVPEPYDSAGPALGAMVRALTRRATSEADPAQQSAIQHALVSMLVAFMSDPGASSSPSVHLSMAQSFIMRHLGEPALSPADVAAACGVSVSHLHRIFANEGGTVAGYVREQRLLGAHRDLSAPLAHEPVSSVGARWGVPNPAHFNRIFKARFGVTPGDLQRSARSGAAAL